MVHYATKTKDVQLIGIANWFDRCSSKKYEILSDIASEYNGKVHGSQRDRDPKTGSIDLLVYYEVPVGNREVVKQRYSNEEFKNFAFD